MNGWLPCLQRSGAFVLAGMIVLGVALETGLAHSESCVLPERHAGVVFPLERVTPHWACRLQPIITNYTSANKIGPARTPLPEEVYNYLLDHPPMAAALVNRLDLGLYQAEMRSRRHFWGSDGEGTEGLFQLVYQDPATRIYYLDGVHNGTLLPPVTGKAVVLLKMHPVTDSNGAEVMETTLVSYVRLNNRLLSGIMSLLRPMVGRIVTRQLTKGFDAADRLSQVMRQEPDRVLFEAMDPPGLPDDEVAFLKRALAKLHNPGGLTKTKTRSP